MLVVKNNIIDRMISNCIRTLKNSARQNWLWPCYQPWRWKNHIYKAFKIYKQTQKRSRIIAWSQGKQENATQEETTFIQGNQSIKRSNETNQRCTSKRKTLHDVFSCWRNSIISRYQIPTLLNWIKLSHLFEAVYATTLSGLAMSVCLSF